MAESIPSFSSRATQAVERVGAIVLLPLERFERLSSGVQDRLMAVVIGAPSWSVLLIALSLTPAAQGVGTHQQLGLGACTMLSITGIPCPMCGMTTTFSHLAHLHILEGAINQPFGLVLFSATVFGALLALADFLAPAARWRRALSWIQRHETLVAIALLGGMIAGWVYKIVMMRGMIGLDA